MYFVSKKLNYFLNFPDLSIILHETRTVQWKSIINALLTNILLTRKKHVWNFDKKQNKASPNLNLNIQRTKITVLYPCGFEFCGFVSLYVNTNEKWRKLQKTDYTFVCRHAPSIEFMWFTEKKSSFDMFFCKEIRDEKKINLSTPRMRGYLSICML